MNLQDIDKAVMLLVLGFFMLSTLREYTSHNIFVVVVSSVIYYMEGVIKIFVNQ